MTAEQFEQELKALDAEGSRVISSAKAQAESSDNLQQEISNGVAILKAHYAQKIEALINEFVAGEKKPAFDPNVTE